MGRIFAGSTAWCVCLCVAALQVALTSASAAAAQAPAKPRAAQRTGGARVNSTAAVEADFERRIADYVQLHKRLEAMLPKLPDNATPQQIDQNQRALGDLVARARAGAKPGDLFTPAMQQVVHRLLAEVFKGPSGRDAKRQIHDEPHPVIPEINKRYPDVVPLSTMPLKVLAGLPKLPDELEYRFIDNHLILMDVHAHLILDYVLNAIPASSPAAKGDTPATKR